MSHFIIDVEWLLCFLWNGQQGFVLTMKGKNSVSFNIKYY